MNKKILIPMLAVLMVGLVVGALSYLGYVERNVTVTPSFEFIGNNGADVSIVGGESVISENLNVKSLTSVIIPVSIDTTPTESGITHITNFVLDNSAGTYLPYPSETCEKRIFIRAEDVGIETLDDLDSISWDADVIDGYLPHVDVKLETDALVFEYAKVDVPCDNAPYPTGDLNTFGDKGIVDSDAKAWLSSGVAGYCGLPEFDNNHKSLSEWKTERGTEKVIGFEIEVDNWISPSNSNIKNILINGNPVEISIKPSDELTFNVETSFGLLNVGDYTIATTVNVR